MLSCVQRWTWQMGGASLSCCLLWHIWLHYWNSNSLFAVNCGAVHVETLKEEYFKLWFFFPSRRQHDEWYMKFDDLMSGGAEVSNFGSSSARVLSYFIAYPLRSSHQWKKEVRRKKKFLVHQLSPSANIWASCSFDPWISIASGMEDAECSL